MIDTPRWDACTQDPHWLFRQIECHPGTAVYVQGALALIGVAIAIYVPWKQANNRLLEKSLAIRDSVAADYFTFRLAVEVLWVQINGGMFKECTPRKTYADMLAAMTLDVPLGFLQARTAIIDSDRKSVKPLSDMLSAITVHNGTVAAMETMYLNSEEWPKALDSVSRSLGGVHDFTAAAWPFFAGDAPDNVPDLLRQSGHNPDGTPMEH